MARFFEWYLSKDFTRPIPETDLALVKRNKSIDLRWNSWENSQYDPIKKYAYLKKRMKPFHPLQPPAIKTNVFGWGLLSSEKNKEKILRKIRAERGFKTRVKNRKKRALREGNHPHRRGSDDDSNRKRRKYWQRFDWKTGDLIPKEYNYIKAQFRVNEMSRLNGDERYIYLQEIRFKADTCEFTPWFQHFLKVRRKWRKEPRIWRTIPWQEIELHKYPNDCWTLIKGRIYDITTFLDIHPGGDIPLRQVFGQDGTWVLIGVHPYIVWYNHMTTIEIGRKPKYHQWGWNFYEPIHQFDGMDTFCEWLWKKPHPLREYFPIETFSYTTTNFCYSVEFPVVRNTTEDHWSFSVLDQRYFQLRFYLEGTDMWNGHLKLPVLLEDDVPYWQFSANFNKLTVTFERPFELRKSSRKKMKKQEYHGMFFNIHTLEHEWHDAYVLRKAYLSKEVILFTIAYDANCYNGVPIGFFVNFRIDDLVRPYTPICFPIVDDPKTPTNPRTPGRRGKMHFIVRLRPEGEMTPLLFDTPKDSGNRRTELQVSTARGLFNTSFLFTEMETMLILAGGTGIAPFTRILQLYRQRATQGLMKGAKVVLIYFNKTEDEMVFDKSFRWLAKVEKRWFHYFPIVSQSSEGDGGKSLKGKPTAKNIRKCLRAAKGAYHKKRKVKVMISGTHGFNHWAELELANMKLTDVKNQFCFLGSM